MNHRKHQAIRLRIQTDGYSAASNKSKKNKNDHSRC
jgi:hypothetical protein